MNGVAPCLTPWEFRALTSRFSAAREASEQPRGDRFPPLYAVHCFRRRRAYVHPRHDPEINSQHQDSRPSFTALTNGRVPRLHGAWVSAPRLRSILSSSSLPGAAAKCSGVLPLTPRRLDPLGI